MSVVTVAKKEFVDHITSKRFLMFLAIILLLTVFSFLQGIGDYRATRISVMEFFGFSGTIGLSSFGSLLGLAMGFDLISKEREGGSLKTLLSHPVYRDQIINGKALGALMAITLVVFLNTVIGLGIVLIKGFTPTIDDMIAIVKFALLTIAYIFTFFSISLLTSTTSKNSGSSLVKAIAIFIVLSFVIPFIGSIVSNYIVGPPPDVYTHEVPIRVGDDKAKYEEIQRKMEERERILNEYYKKKRAISELFEIFSPGMNYMKLISKISESNMFFESEDVTKNFVGFVVLPVVMFTLSYIRFLRSEIT
ncbi:ABC-type transport system involved in multi-copper enzyme maturation, permease component [Archaeoglobus sulfaticallidus PM70-1]|uniref:ABC-type transport system involved in multi-copper enzyme maturation, permease component n=1 Tax=Archaeoglobus sulfaticallidus PM70-1 TaxID=387631 RepID=N0BJX6_9EURY|nr:ABC transporter permease subunit [Archaeoglobus sulfaticallidus]AGK60435.1 ABC-type transport system involved in multi-copper enzyme maturation, permease component [Archaeoglobus sulfaticallidus PM70-1]